MVVNVAPVAHIDETVEPVEITPLTPKRRFVKTPGTTNKTGRAASTDIYASFESRSRYVLIPIDRLEFDYSYQRKSDLQRQSRMAHDWQPDLCGALVVNRRNDGRIFVIDGQQRVGAMRMISNRPETTLAQLFENLSVEQEAILFKELDTRRQGLTQGAIFQALVTAGDPAALEILKCATDAGLTMNPNSSAPNNLRAFGDIRTIHRRSGKEVLSRIFKVVATAWPENKYWGSGSILKGLEVFFKEYPQVNDRHLTDALSKSTPQDIENKARMMSQAMSSSIGKWVARVIHGLYNHGMKANRLPDWE